MSRVSLGARMSLAALALACLAAPLAWGHPASPPPIPVTPPAEVEPIPDDDQDLYHARVTAIKPQVPGLAAEVLGGDEKLQITWVGAQPLVILGFQGEPMARLSSAGVEINKLSPSVYLAADRYAQVPTPVNVDPKAAPQWSVIDTPGPFSLFDHRIHWRDADRPPIVGDGTEPVTIFHWAVPALLGERRVTIFGVLDWVPDPGAVRSGRSQVSNPLLSAGILIAAMALGASLGVLFRRRARTDCFAW